jgi:hypothetical protein
LVPSVRSSTPIGRRVGDHIRQGPRPHPRLAGHGEAAGGQQRADLADGAGDGGAVDPEQHRQGLVRQLQAQHDQGHQHPVAHGQPLVGPAPAARRRGAAAVGQCGLVLGGPGVGQFGDELAQVLPGDAGAARTG